MTKNAKEKIVLKEMMVPVKEKTALKTPVKKNPPMMMTVSLRSLLLVMTTPQTTLQQMKEFLRLSVTLEENLSKADKA